MEVLLNIVHICGEAAKLISKRIHIILTTPRFVLRISNVAYLVDDIAHYRSENWSYQLAYLIE
jgi:hypothetical protein